MALFYSVIIRGKGFEEDHQYQNDYVGRDIRLPVSLIDN